MHESEARRPTSSTGTPWTARKCPVSAPQREEVPGQRPAARGSARSEDDLAGLAAGAEEGDGLVEDVGGLGLRAPLLHVGEVRLVGLDLRGRGRVLAVQAGRE